MLNGNQNAMYAADASVCTASLDYACYSINADAICACCIATSSVCITAAIPSELGQGAERTDMETLNCYDELWTVWHELCTICVSSHKHLALTRYALYTYA
jgi:hypothetical protein